MNDIEAKATNYYHGAEHYNCAQAVLKAFQAHPKDIETFKAYGTGRAPGNICGALYAICFLVGKNQAAQEKLTKEFKSQVGATTCKAIRQMGKTSCRDCVKIAAKLLTECT